MIYVQIDAQMLNALSSPWILTLICGVQMGDLDLAWRIYSALKATGMEPADYPPINTWMASQVLEGLDPATKHGHDRQQEVRRSS